VRDGIVWREEQMFQWDPDQGLHAADRGDMRLNGLQVTLEGRFEGAGWAGTSATKPAKVQSIPPLP